MRKCVEVPLVRMCAASRLVSLRGARQRDSAVALDYRLTLNFLG